MPRVIKAMFMIERVVAGAPLLTTFFGATMGMRPEMGVGVLNAAVAVALASQRLIAQQCPIRHGKRLPGRREGATMTSHEPEPYSLDADCAARGGCRVKALGRGRADARVRWAGDGPGG